MALYHHRRRKDQHRCCLQAPEAYEARAYLGDENTLFPFFYIPPHRYNELPKTHGLDMFDMYVYSKFY